MYVHVLCATQQLPIFATQRFNMSRLFAASDKSVRVWRVDDGKCVGLLVGVHKKGINDLAWCPQSSYIVDASDDKTLASWDVEAQVLESQHACCLLLSLPTSFNVNIARCTHFAETDSAVLGPQGQGDVRLLPHVGKQGHLWFL